jgi:formylglycine-generating enzyme required for sulfatase activity
MQRILDTLHDQPKALTFCENLRNRAGLIADYGRDHYIFRHKSFREFLCGIQLKEDSYQSGRIETLISHFKEEWWSEPLRFFMSNSNDKIFDRFMRFFFQSEVSRQLEDNQMALLQHLVREAPQKRVDALADSLNSDKLNDLQRRCVMDCLKTIGTPEAIKAIETVDKNKLNKDNLSYAEDILAEVAPKMERIREKPGIKELFLGSSFRNPFEYNVEYIKIPGGTFKYSGSGEMVTVPDLFFCKYPVTNKEYRRFIFFLEGGEKELQKDLPMGMFAEKLLQFSESIKGYRDFLGKDPKGWQEKFRSRFDDDERLNGDDQPVVSVTWYAARAYCFWLSCLEAVIRMGDKLEDINRVASMYRLPTGKEWEWAAGGEPDGSIREYPWAKDKGDPRPTLANYGGNVDTTTPVGRYSEGATPQGLMDMAGNVWEWMGSYYDMKKDRFALRGGSWFNVDRDLRCTSRIDNIIPHYQENHTGFRTVRSQP